MSAPLDPAVCPLCGRTDCVGCLTGNPMTPPNVDLSYMRDETAAYRCWWEADTNTVHYSPISHEDFYRKEPDMPPSRIALWCLANVGKLLGVALLVALAAWLLS